MRNTPLIPSKTLLSFFVVLILMSCTKDMDLLLEYSVQEEEEVAQTTAEEESEEPGSNDTPPDDSPPDTQPYTNRADDFVSCSAGEGTQYNPTSAADIQNAANAGRTAVITNSFDCDGCTFASGQTIIPSGGVISGTGINVNGACILDDFSQLFTASVTFNNPYNNSRLSPETFGANGSDGGADDMAISALINNVEYAKGKSNSVYIKNSETTYSRAGLFDWDLAGAKIETTSTAQLSHGSAVNNQNTYLFMFKGLDNISVYNGEFDGNDLASRLFWLEQMEQYYFSNLIVHNYFSPAGAYARGTAFSIKPNPSTYGFTQGEMKDMLIENIGAASDGNANNSPYGVAKAISYNVYGNGTANIYHDNITINNIYGDDAEGFYNRNTSGYSHNSNNVHFYITNSTFKACQRRAIKLNASNATIQNNYFETATNEPIFSGAQASYIQIFSIIGGEPIQNVNFSNNELQIVGNSKNSALGMNDCKNIIIDSNKFSSNRVFAQGNIGISTTSTQNGLYSGDIGEDVEFTNNIITNLFTNIGGLYNTTGNGPFISGNTINLTTVGVDNPGKYWAAYSLVSSTGAMSGDPLTISNTIINVTINGSDGLGLFGGVFNTQGMEPKGITFEEVTINYSGVSLPPYAFAYTGKNNTSSDFDSTNTITNCTVNGAIGTGAVMVKGNDQSVIITNSFGDGGTPITKL